ncbi:MAG: hypothetical protein ABR554_05670 [Pyrinomonadaceae bacterium]
MRKKLTKGVTGRAAVVVAALLSVATATAVPRDAMRVTVERNAGGGASAAFKFKRVPAPARDDAATGARLALVVGQRDANSATLAALTDGALPSNEDEPRANFFFNAGTDGGRFLIDLGSAVEIAEVNSYSWHASSRAAQVYNLYASDGSAPNFDAAPDERTHPASRGWKLIATVDTRPARGEAGTQHGASVNDAGGSLGKYRYLLFDAVPTEYDDPFGNTFFSEVDVIAKK